LDSEKDKSVLGEPGFPLGGSLRYVRPINNLLELLPGPAVFWSLKRHFCIPNRKAHRWVASAKNDFREYASRWTRKINRSDRQKFFSVWELLQRTEAVQCDYRFSPPDLEQHIWLRESSTYYRNSRGEAEGLISVYTDISDLKSQSPIETEHPGDPAESPTLPALAHDIGNCIQYISMELELMGLNSQTPMPLELLDRLNQLQWRARQLLDCRVTRSDESAEASHRPVLENMVRRFWRKLFPHGIELEIHSDEGIPEVQIGAEALCQILEQLVEFYSVQLKGSGKLKMEFRVVRAESYEQLEVKLSSAAHDQWGSDSVRPFLQIDESRVQVSTTVAQEILRHHREKVSFATSCSDHAALTIRFDVKQGGR
jgi:hypothetical protein